MKKKTPATAEQPAETAANETQPAEPPHSPSPQHKPSARDVVPESPGRMLRAAAVKDIKEKNKMVRQTARAVTGVRRQRSVRSAVCEEQGLPCPCSTLQRLLRKAKPWEAWDLETALHKAETKASEAYLAIVEAKYLFASASLLRAEAQLASKELRIKQLSKRVTMRRIHPCACVSLKKNDAMPMILGAVSLSKHSPFGFPHRLGAQYNLKNRVSPLKGTDFIPMRLEHDLRDTSTPNPVMAWLSTAPQGSVAARVWHLQQQLEGVAASRRPVLRRPEFATGLVRSDGRDIVTHFDDYNNTALVLIGIKTFLIAPPDALSWEERPQNGNRNERLDVNPFIRGRRYPEPTRIHRRCTVGAPWNLVPRFHGSTRSWYRA